MIEVQNLSLSLPGFELKQIDFSVGVSEYFIVVGPYASGKTVLLETIAGLYSPSSGSIMIGGVDVTDLEPEKRGVGVVYQDCALFPHLSVRENICFGLKTRGDKPADISRELKRVSVMFGIGDLLDRSIRNLSGGERQKVALARAIAPGPKALLLDEPLGALDPNTREEVRQALLSLHSSLDIPIIHITHDFEEAAEMGSRMAVMGAGRIMQIGTPDDIFRHPESEFVARFTMALNILKGSAFKNDQGLVVFETEGVSLVSCDTVLGECVAAIRPESILISDTPPDNSEPNVLFGVVSRTVSKGSTVNVLVDVPPVFTALLTRHDFDSMGLKAGDKVCLTIPTSSVSLFLG